MSKITITIEQITIKDNSLKNIVELMDSDDKDVVVIYKNHANKLITQYINLFTLSELQDLLDQYIDGSKLNTKIKEVIGFLLLTTSVIEEENKND